MDNLLKNRIGETIVCVGQNQMKVLAVTMNLSDQSNIELVNTKAEAGYLDSYINPEFFKELPIFHFPNLPRGHNRGFEILGDSILPLESSSIVICQRLTLVSDNEAYL